MSRKIAPLVEEVALALRIRYLIKKNWQEKLATNFWKEKVARLSNFKVKS
jgi:hypothetical protein